MKYIANPGFRVIVFVSILSVISLMLVGCGSVPGETSTERSVRYGSITRSNYELMKSDVDTLLMMDKRSKLNDTIVRDY